MFFSAGPANLEPSTLDAVQGMLSMSKAAIRFPSQGDPSDASLLASQDGLKIEGPSDNLSPHMDNSLANLSILARKSNPPIRNPKITLGLSRYNNQNNEEEDDFEEQLKQCHQDGDYSEFFIDILHLVDVISLI